MSALTQGLYAIRQTISLLFNIPDDYFEQKEKDRKVREQILLRHFKIEVTHGFWGTRTRIIQRDTPLTNEQLNDINQVSP